MKALVAAISSISILVLASCAPGPDAGAGDAPIANAAWTLDPQASRIAFASIKAGEVIETHYFPGLSGSITADGEASVTVPLDQVETKIEIRNERMRNMFFETGTYPTANISAAVNPVDFSDLSIGERRQTEIDGTLSLRGQSEPVFVEAFVTRIAADRIEIETAEPVVIFVSDFGLEPGLEALREVAGLPSITAAVPVTFTFVFDAQG